MKNRRQRGFSLVELSIVLVIVALMIGGLVTPLGMQIEQRKRAETQKALEEAREALLGFALRYGYLPCPAISARNGLEDRSGNRCSENKRDGYLPWATLGLSRLDNWDHLYRYSVTPAFADSLNLFTLSTPRDISVLTRDETGAMTAATGHNDIPALILSHGKNGYGASGALGQRIANAAAAGAGINNADEKNNATTAQDFISRGASGDSAGPGGEFDDLLVWLSPNILYNRMVAAQRLP